MRCIACKHGQTELAAATVSIERGGILVVVRGVPASVCTECGEEYLDAAVMAELEVAVDKAQAAGVEVAVRAFKAA